MDCADKNKYFSEDEANDVAEHQEKINNIKLRSYHCRCGWWHLTKNLNPVPYIKKNKYINKVSKKCYKTFSDLFQRK